MAIRQSVYGKRKPTHKYVCCYECHKLFDFDLDRCPYCGFDRSKMKRSYQYQGAKGGWT